jgi:hypothetical protein
MIPLVRSLQSSVRNSQISFFRSGGSDLKLGYITFPRITGDPSVLTYFSSEGLLGVLSAASNEISIVRPQDKSVTKRFSAEGTNPKAPSIFFPPTSSAFYISDGGIDEDGLVSFSLEGQINTLVNTGDGDISEIFDAVYNPINREAYLIDVGQSRIHRINTEGNLKTNFYPLAPSTNSIYGIDLDRDQNRLLIADSENNKFRVIDLDSKTETEVDLSFEPFGVAWDEQNNLIYVVSQSFSFINVYDKDLNSLNVINELDYPGLITDIRYNPTYRKMQLKVTVGYLGKDNLLFIDYDSFKEKLFITNALLPEFDINRPITFVRELDTFYFLYNNSLRGYKALHTPQQTKTLGGKASILTSLNFPDRSGIVSIEGLTLTVISDTFNVRNNNVNLADQFSDYISNTDSCVFAEFYSLKSENALFLGFDNGVLLAVNSNFGVIKQLKTSDFIITVNGSDVLVNDTNIKSVYEVISMGYNRLFNLLYICFPKGNSTESSSNNGSVVIFNIENGLSDASPIAYRDPPDSVNKLRSLEVSPSASLLYLMGETDGNSILQSFDFVPKNGNLTLRSQQTADSNPTNLVEFSKSIVYSSGTSGQLSYVRTIVGAEQRKVDLEGSFKEVVASSEEYGFLYTIDTTNNRLLAFNEAFELYGLTQIQGTPKALTTFNDSVYVSYSFSEISLPSLTTTISSTDSVNQINLNSNLGTKVEVGDIIEVTQGGERYLLLSLSEGNPEDQQIFVDTFSPLEDLIPENTNIKLTGDRVVKISQEGIERVEKSQVANFIQENSINSEFDSYYSTSFDPYLLINNLESEGFQEINGLYQLLGNRKEGKISSLSYYKEPFLYFVNNNSQLFRLNLLDRSLQRVRLDRDIDTIEDFLVSQKAIYLIEGDTDTLFKLTITNERADEIEFSTSETLGLSNSPQSIYLSSVEDTINVYTSFATHFKVSL